MVKNIYLDKLGRLSIVEQSMFPFLSKPSFAFNRLISLLGPHIKVVPLSTIASHPYEQILIRFFTVTLFEKNSFYVLKYHFTSTGMRRIWYQVHKLIYIYFFDTYTWY
jgi:hypothetical protein